MNYHNPKPIRVVSKVLRDAARGQECTLRMPWCNNNPETTVHCHIRAFGMSGLNQKPQDTAGYHGCSECHRREDEAGWDDLLRAVLQTQDRLLQAGIISVKGFKQ